VAEARGGGRQENLIHVFVQVQEWAVLATIRLKLLLGFHEVAPKAPPELLQVGRHLYVIARKGLQVLMLVIRGMLCNTHTLELSGTGTGSNT